MRLYIMIGFVVLGTQCLLANALSKQPAAHAITRGGEIYKEVSSHKENVAVVVSTSGALEEVPSSWQSFKRHKAPYDSCDGYNVWTKNEKRNRKRLSVRWCKKWCETSAGCTGFNYNSARSTKGCYFLKAVALTGDCKVGRQSKKMTLYVRSTPTPPSPPPPTPSQPPPPPPPQPDAPRPEPDAPQPEPDEPDAPPPPPPPPPPSHMTSRPHIIFMLADDMGWNDVGYHNPDYGKGGLVGKDYLGNGGKDWKNDARTPNINALAEEGLKLESLYAHEVCSPSRSAFLTGRYPSRTGVGPSVVKPCDTYGVPARFKMLPQILKNYDYKSYLVGKWHLGMASAEFTPTQRGFDEWVGVSTGEADFFTWYYMARPDNEDVYGSVLQNATQSSNLKDGSTARFLKDFPGRDDPHNVASHLVYAREVDRLLSRHAADGPAADSPSFIYMAFQNPHEGFNIKPNADFTGFDPDSHHHVNQYIDASGNEQKCVLDTQGPGCTRSSFVEMMSDMDDAIGMIVESYKKYGLWDNTVLIFQSDNGGAQYGKRKQRYSGSNYPLDNMKGNGKKHTNEGGIRVPGFIRSTSPHFSVPPGQSYHLMHIIDWYATINAIAHGTDESVPLGTIDGIDMSDRIRNHENKKKYNSLYIPRASIIHTAQPGCAGCGVVRAGKYKLYMLDKNSYKASLPDSSRSEYNGNKYMNIYLNGCFEINEMAVISRSWKTVGEKKVSDSNCAKARTALKEYLADPNLLVDWRLREPDDLGQKNPCVQYQHDALASIDGTPLGQYFKIGWFDPATSSLRHPYDYAQEMLQTDDF